MTPEPQDKPTRLPFYVEFFETANAFSTDVLAKIPELEALAIVPLWSPSPEDVPVGAFRVRAEGELFLPQLYKTLGQISKFNMQLHQKLAEQLRVVDQYAQKLNEEITKLHAEYEKLKPEEQQKNA